MKRRQADDTQLVRTPSLRALLAAVATWIAATAALAALELGRAAPIAGIAFAAFLVARQVVRARLVAGDDGLRLGKRFVAWSEVERIEPVQDPHGNQQMPRVATLVLRGGESIPLCMAWSLSLRTSDDVATELRDLEDRLGRFRARGRSALADELTRRDESDEAWLERVRAHVGGAAFREQPVRREDLVALVEDAAAEPTARAAAVCALSRKLTSHERVRVRLAAGTSASPRVRVVLEAAADESIGDEEVAALAARVERQSGKA